MIALGLGLRMGQPSGNWTPAMLFSGAAGFWSGSAEPYTGV